MLPMGPKRRGFVFFEFSEGTRQHTHNWELPCPTDRTERQEEASLLPGPVLYLEKRVLRRDTEPVSILARTLNSRENHMQLICLQKTPVPPPSRRRHQEKQGPGPTSGKRRPGKKIHIIRISKMVHKGRKQFLPPDVLRGIRRLSFAYIDAHLA